MVVRDLIAPVIPEQFHRRTLGRIAGHVPEMQASSILSEQVGYQSGTLGGMNLGPVCDDDHSTFAASRAGYAFFDQLAEGGGIAFLGSDPDNLAGAPIGRGTFLALGRTHARSANLALLTTQHPHPREGGKQTQLGFVLNIEIGPARGMI